MVKFAGFLGPGWNGHSQEHDDCVDGNQDIWLGKTSIMKLDLCVFAGFAGLGKQEDPKKNVKITRRRSRLIVKQDLDSDAGWDGGCEDDSSGGEDVLESFSRGLEQVNFCIYTLA